MKDTHRGGIMAGETPILGQARFRGPIFPSWSDPSTDRSSSARNVVLRDRPRPRHDGRGGRRHPRAGGSPRPLGGRLPARVRHAQEPHRVGMRTTIGPTARRTRGVLRGGDGALLRAAARLHDAHRISGRSSPTTTGTPSAADEATVVEPLGRPTHHSAGSIARVDELRGTCDGLPCRCGRHPAPCGPSPTSPRTSSILGRRHRPCFFPVASSAAGVGSTRSNDSISSGESSMPHSSSSAARIVISRAFFRRRSLPRGLSSLGWPSCQPSRRMRPDSPLPGDSQSSSAGRPSNRCGTSRASPGRGARTSRCQGSTPDGSARPRSGRSSSIDPSRAARRR